MRPAPGTAPHMAALPPLPPPPPSANGRRAAGSATGTGSMRRTGEQLSPRRQDAKSRRQALVPLCVLASWRDASRSSGSKSGVLGVKKSLCFHADASVPQTIVREQVAAESHDRRWPGGGSGPRDSGPVGLGGRIPSRRVPCAGVLAVVAWRKGSARVYYV